MVSREKKFILWFDELSIDDVGLVGGKNASLGEMYRRLTKKGVRIPNGFAITAHAYEHLLKTAGIQRDIKDALHGLNVKNVHNLAERGRKVREIIYHAEFPEDLRAEIYNAYRKLSKEYRMKNADVAVRSSATAEDLPDASFAGQQETFLNVRHDEELIESCKKCFASLFTNRAIAYREEKGFNHFKVYLSIGVQKMVRSDQSSSGVMFTLDTESGHKDVVFITSIYGLGENIVQGKVNPDEFYVHKPTLRKNFRSIIKKTLGEKDMKMIYTEGSKGVKDVNVSLNDRRKFAISDDEVITLAKWGVIIEDHYTERRKKWMPMDIEWAKDGRSGELFIVQARPETVQSQKNWNIIETYKLKSKGKLLAEGKSVGSKIGAGTAQVIRDVKEISKFKTGDVLVTEMTDPDWVPIMRKAKAIVTNRGGRTCHAAIVSRELGITCVVGTNNATEKVKNGQKVTVSCAEGETGKVYEGMLKFEKKVTDARRLKKPKTKIMMNLSNPDEAFALSFIPNDGVGLAREEFIILNNIKVHPMALLHYDKLEQKTKARIDEITHGYKSRTEFFVDKLSQGVATIAAAFYPKDVIVRTSDFKSNEYAGLIGGMMFEPKEDNPMIGWRGASRYYTKYKEAFELECKALKKVRDEMGLTNVKVMIPFCRTAAEGKNVITVMAKNGLIRKKNGLEVYVMCEIPSNVILAERFGEIFDGFSIGSNDLTQLTLGVDRDSELVADIYDERNDAVKGMIAHVISVAKKIKRKIGICGQGPSDYPEFAQFLVKHRIDSISLNPDSIMKTIPSILKAEKRR